MTINAETPAEENNAGGLSAADQASVEVGQRGLSETTGVNERAPEGEQRPEWCPEQFWKDGKADTEGLAKSYAELRTKMDTPKEEPKADAPKEGEAPVDANGKIEKKADEAPAAAPLATAIEKVRNEYASGQAVSDETVAELEAAGIPKEILSVYLQGLTALSNQTMGEIHGFAGGKDEYDSMARWAAEKLSDEELDAFNTSLDNPQLRETAVRGLYARYSSARPSEGSLVTPAGSPSAAGDVYASRDDMIADQKDPRYATDAKFRQDVLEKLQRSQRAGFQLVQRSMFEKQVYSN